MYNSSCTEENCMALYSRSCAVLFAQCCENKRSWWQICKSKNVPNTLQYILWRHCFLLTTLFQIFCWILKWKKFENRLQAVHGKLQCGMSVEWVLTVAYVYKPQHLTCVCTQADWRWRFIIIIIIIIFPPSVSARLCTRRQNARVAGDGSLTGRRHVYCQAVSRSQVSPSRLARLCTLLSVC